MKLGWILFITVVLIVLGIIWSKRSSMNAFPTYLYKITTPELWQASQGKEQLELTSMDDEFIHLSEQHQVQKIIAKFFSDAPEVVVITLDPKKLPGTLVKEQNPGGTNKYFHLYGGSIPLKAVVNVKIVDQQEK